MDERRTRHQQARSRRAGQRKQRRQNKQNKAGMRCIVLIVLCLLVGISVQIHHLWGKNEAYKVKEKQLTNQLELELERQEEIAAYEEYAATPEYIVELAKTKLGLVNENEIIFKERKPEE